MELRFSYDIRFERLISSIRRRYGEEILSFSGVHPSQLDMAKFTRDFLFSENINLADISVDANANVDDRSVVSFDHEVAKALNKLNAYNMIWSYVAQVKRAEGDGEHAMDYASRAIEDLITGNLYLNDAHFVHKSYCFAYDLTPMVVEGMPFIKKVNIGPPKHYGSFIDLVIQSTAFISNQIAGAASYPNLLFFMDYFIRKDYGERYWESSDAMRIVLQEIQSLVYSFNFPFRSAQSAFVNMSIYDRGFFDEIFGSMIFPDGSRPTYENLNRLQDVFMRWYNEESKKQNFTFPVLTSNHVFENGAFSDPEFLDQACEANMEFGALNFYTGPAQYLSSCCRLRNKLVKGHTNSLGTGSLSIGSHRVCTINLPRVAIEADGNIKKFFDILHQRITSTHMILHAHRAIIKDLISRGKLPLYTHNWMNLNQQYSTVGLIGPYEACKFMGMDIRTEEGSQLILDVMDQINERNSREEESYKDGRLFNLELIPGEQAAVKMRDCDALLFPDFRPLRDIRLYSNQFIPLTERCDISDRIRLQGLFDSRAQGGCIMHANVDHRLRNAEQMKTLVSSAARTGAMYFAINFNIARCAQNHYTVAKVKDCPTCGGPIVSNRTRVVGFITDVSDWPKVRRWEFGERHFYDLRSDEEREEDEPLEVPASA